MFKWMYVHVKENKKKSIWIIVDFLPAVGILVLVHIFSKPDNIGALISYSQTGRVMQ
jgi:hypothetical protein